MLSLKQTDSFIVCHKKSYMNPNDAHATLPPGQRHFRVLITSGYTRRQFNCLGVDSKFSPVLLRQVQYFNPEEKAFCQ
jgi:hypothetical protein